MLASDQAAEEGTYQSFPIGAVHNSSPGRVDRDSSYPVRSDTLSHPVERGFRSPDLVTGAIDEVDNSTPVLVRRDRSRVERSDTLSHPVMRGFPSLDLVTGATDEGMVLDGLRPVGDRPTVEEVAASVDVELGAHFTATVVLGDSYTVAESFFSTDEGVLMAGSPTFDGNPHRR